MILSHDVMRKILKEEEAEAKVAKRMRNYLFKKYSEDRNAVDDETVREIHRKWTEAGQSHVFQFVEELNAKEIQVLYHQIYKFVDIDEIAKVKESAFQLEKELSSAKSNDITPPEIASLETASKEDRNRWREIGFDILAKSKCGVLVLAGGQGSRLGSPLPKGMYDVGLPSHKTLFQIQAERILKLQSLVETSRNLEKDSVTIPLYVMTSASTHRDTKGFFVINDFFGLKEENVIFFQQGTLPALDLQGKVFMESKQSVFVAPDGNGGLYKALREKHVLEDMERRGIEWLSQYCVDNVLSQVCDPLFIGFVAEQKSLVGCKTVQKLQPHEKMGIIAKKNGKLTVVEYSELSTELSEAKDPEGNLLLRAGHICVNLFHIDFLRKAGIEYPTKFHIAKKKISHVNEKGEIVVPTKENSIKFEQFIFDPWEHLDSLAILEVPRGEEFAALKNAPGSTADTPDSSRFALSLLHQKWIKDAGGIVLEAHSPEDSLCEVSPLVSLRGEGLEFAKGKTFQMPCEISSNGDRLVVTSWTYLNNQ